MGDKPSNYYMIEPYQWKKGQSGNPKGKPKGTINIKTRLEKMFNTKFTLINAITGAKETRCFHEILFMKTLPEKLLMEGDGTMIKEVFDRMFGKVSQNVKIDNANESKVNLSGLSEADLKALSKCKRTDTAKKILKKALESGIEGDNAA